VSQTTVIGIDLDNTLACYDEIFHRAACQEGLIAPDVSQSKERIRDAIRLLPDGETQWTRLQAIVYGPRMSEARLFEGAAEFLRHCAANGVRTLIVSHKTPFAMLDGTRVDLRKAALEWLDASGFFGDYGIAREDVFFEATRAEKIERIRSERCTHFIDDLAEVFAESAFPSEIVKVLFAPHGTNSDVPDVCICASWDKIRRFFFP
jgi:hypothetical protein